MARRIADRAGASLPNWWRTTAEMVDTMSRAASCDTTGILSRDAGLDPALAALSGR
ncbi:hypothetical protein [Nocardioides sp.]|uniref:hypothetical protein n=1 Tax=Nocardioides sp. TaxID=35761 RepID=UPI002C5C1A92|nr:hypothetical protein [Nocardioides sp.]HXH78152.1 hypothetical protein [Nocardioides sp.]